VAVVWLWNVWDAATPLGRPTWLPVLAAGAMFLIIGWRATQVDLSQLTQHGDRVLLILRPMLRPDFIQPRSEKLEGWAEDRRIALDIRIKQFDQEIREARKAARQLPSLQEKLNAKRTIKQLEQHRDQLMLDYHEEKKRIDAEEDRLLTEIEAALEIPQRRVCSPSLVPESFMRIQPAGYHRPFRTHIQIRLGEIPPTN
jgi:hypothetical protein